MHPYRPPRFPIHAPMNQTFRSPFMRFPMQNPYQETRGLGNLFSKLLGQTGKMPANFHGFPNSGIFSGAFGPGITPGIGAPFHGAGAPGLANLMSNFTSGGLPEMLTNVQKALGLAQQFGPMIQQYGPLVKNMPAMLKIMKELNTADSTDEEIETSQGDFTANATVGDEELDLPDFNELKLEPIVSSYKPSTPKLYI